MRNSLSIKFAIVGLANTLDEYARRIRSGKSRDEYENNSSSRPIESINR